MKINLALVLFAIIISVVAYGLYTSIEFYDETSYESWSSKAKRNPFLAAEQFLQQRGHRVESSNSLRSLDTLPAAGTVYINHNRQALSQQRVDNLMQWVQDGGHLIVAAYINDNDSRDILLDQFEIHKEQASCDCEDEQDIDPNQDKKLSEILHEANQQIKQQSVDKNNNSENKKENDIVDKSELTTLHFQNVKEPVQVNFSRSTAITHPLITLPPNQDYQGPKPIYWENNKAGAQFIQFELDQGLLSVLSDGNIWNSLSINEYDHAYLLSILAGDNKQVLILYGTQMPSLLKLLNDKAPEFIMASLVCLVMWLIFSARRFGPIKKNDDINRRSLEEHIHACSKLLWYSKQAEKIIEKLHESIHRQLRHSNPNFADMEKQQKIDWLSHKCSLPETVIEQALYPKDMTSQEDFYNIVHVGQQIIKNIGNR